MSEHQPTFEDVRAAATRLAGRIVHTPLLRNRLLDELTGAAVLVKPEALQRTGSFKLRGATNAALLLSAEQRRGGIVTHSSGNHGQGCAAAAHMLGMKSTIAMPSDAPSRWRRRAAGGRRSSYDRHGTDREALADPRRTAPPSSALRPSACHRRAGTVAPERSRMRARSASRSMPSRFAPAAAG